MCDISHAREAFEIASLALGFAGFAIGVFGYAAPRHWLLAGFTRFRDAEESGRRAAREEIGIGGTGVVIAVPHGESF